MQYKGVNITQLKNKNLLLKLPNGGRAVIGCNKFMNDDDLKNQVEIFLRQNPNVIDNE